MIPGWGGLKRSCLVASSLEKTLEPASWYVISWRVGTLWFSLMLDLFRSFGSPQILSDPSTFVCWATYPSSCWAVIPCFTMSDSSALIFSQYFIGTHHWPCWKRGTLGSTVVWYCPGTLPTMSKDSVKVAFKELMLVFSVLHCFQDHHIHSKCACPFWWIWSW